MAQRTITQLVDDIEGTEIADGKGETVTFGLDGVTFELDLTDKNAKKLREALKFYADHARRVSGGRGRPAGRSSGSAKRDPGRLKAVREWAKENGHTVSERGRISSTVMDAYEAAH